jgi:GTP:adenosylcobinamide-phosphate guanylyltransferase
MDAIVTAGGIPLPGEPLYVYTQGKNKAMLDICGKPMVQWVLDALNAALTIDQIIIVGLTAEDHLISPKVTAYIPNQGAMLDNIHAGMLKVQELNPQATHVLFVSSDIPGITSEMVDWTVQNAQKTNDDIYYNVIERAVMEKRYPGSKRSYTHLKDVEVCGGDMNVVRIMTDTSKDALWTKLISARKNVFKQASLIGWDTLFYLLTRRITLEQGIQTVTSRLHLTGRAVLCPYAEIGMDVDKPFQLEIMRADLDKVASA